MLVFVAISGVAELAPVVGLTVAAILASLLAYCFIKSWQNEVAAVK
ncbi:hypothetical protein [Sporomusa ovata]|nr:hypothetical protein [Sporomusa ovata]